jgi:hypothetical protein
MVPTQTLNLMLVMVELDYLLILLGAQQLQLAKMYLELIITLVAAAELMELTQAQVAWVEAQQARQETPTTTQLQILVAVAVDLETQLQVRLAEMVDRE